jgi:two-component sensor histidine kinase/CheY-like chemotaxis protein
MTDTRPKLLYVDDDPGLGRLVQKGLERLGCAVETATCGEDGLARLAAGGIDAVGLDQNMPGLDGLQTLSRIRDLPDPPPVVFVTGSEDSRVAIAALKAGASDYVIKDIEGSFVPKLKEAIDGAIDVARARRAKDVADHEMRTARVRFEALAAERALLLREVNHRVSNSLQLIASMLQLQGNAAPSPDVKTAMVSATGRVLAVAQVHRRLYTSDDVQTVALDQYLSGLLEDLRRSAAGGSLGQLTLAAAPVFIHPDRAVAIGGVVSELVLNAVKYAYPESKGPIRVRLESQLPLTVLIVEDDGVGHAAGSPPVSTGLGQRIVTAMAQKLDADLRTDDGHKGTRIVLTFPA